MVEKSWIIGGGADCDLVVDQSVVSARHCRLIRKADGFYLDDLGSSNGTFVNGVRIKNAVRVTAADRVTLGQRTLMPWPTATSEPAEAQQVISIGRAPDNDIVADHASVSKRHARIFVRAEHALLEDLDSRNGTFIDGKRISRAFLAPTSDVRCGSYDIPAHLLQPYVPQSTPVHDVLKTEYQPDLKPPVNPKSTVTLKMTGDSMIVGRDASCDHKVDHPLVSGHHARLSRAGKQLFVEDLKSTNGTFVDGRRIHQRTAIQPGNAVAFGSVVLEVSVGGDLRRHDSRGNITLEAHRVTVDVPGKRLLEDVSFTITPGELVGLMGPSGAGKSTLMHALNGYAPPSEGLALINGRDIYQEYDLFRGQIGYVPQDDIIHQDLTVRQALYYTARLRLPRDFSENEIGILIDHVLQQLGLQATKDVLIGSPEKKGISGGQRKRVNLAMELLTDPSVLFLDEPTSGLSSEDALMVMKLLRDLANDGKTILVTIHQPSLEVFRLMDNLVLVGKDSGSAEPGRLVYYGPAYPDAVWFFNPNDASAAIEDATPSPDEVLRGYAKQQASVWIDRYTHSETKQKFVDARAGKTPAHRELAPRSGDPITAILQQWLTLSQRCFQIKVKDRANTVILLAQAPIIATLVAMVFGNQVSEEVTAASWPAIGNAVAITVFLLALAGLWFGCSNSAREIVGEWAIYRRERMVNLMIPAVVASKFTVLGGLCLLQCSILMTIVYLGAGLAGPWLGMFLVLLLTSLVGLAIGLTISAVARSSEVAIALLPLILIPMVILAGVLQPVHKMNSAIRSVAQVMPSRWAFEGLLLLEIEDRQTWTPPALPVIPSTTKIPAAFAQPDQPVPSLQQPSGDLPDSDDTSTSREFEEQDMAETFFPKEKQRTGTAASSMALISMLIVLVAAIHVILRVRDVH